MIAKLRKDHLVVANEHDVCTLQNAIKFDITKKEGYKYEVKINNEPYQELKDNVLEIPVSVLGNEYVIISLKETSVHNKKSKEYSTDQIKIGKYVTFGESISEVYPETLAYLIKRLDALEARIEKIENEGEIL